MDKEDSEYIPFYNNADDGYDRRIAKGYSYHQVLKEFFLIHSNNLGTRMGMGLWLFPKSYDSSK